MPMLPPRRLPLLPVPLLLLARQCRDRYSAAGNGAGSLCASVFHDYRAARASRLSRAFCGFRRATPRASPLDLTDEQPPGTAIRRSTAAISHFQIEESSCLIKLQWLAPAYSPPRPLSPELPSRPSLHLSTAASSGLHLDRPLCWWPDRLRLGSRPLLLVRD